MVLISNGSLMMDPLLGYDKSTMLAHCPISLNILTNHAIEGPICGVSITRDMKPLLHFIFQSIIE